MTFLADRAAPTHAAGLAGQTSAINTYGFAILDQLHGPFEYVDSFLMDRETLLAFESQWGIEEQPTTRDLNRLTAEESALYDALRDQRIRRSLRFEQERVGFCWVQAALDAPVTSFPDIT